MVSDVRPTLTVLARRCLPALLISLCLVLAWQILRGPVTASRAYDTPRRVLQSLTSSLTSSQRDAAPSSSSSSSGRQSQHHNMTQQKVVFFKAGVPFYVHRAFRDDRATFNVIRIFGVEKKNLVSGNVTCRWLRHDHDQDDVTQEVPGRKYLIDTSWPEWSDFYAFNIDCVLPGGAKPSNVHLVSRELGIDFEMRVEETMVTKPRKDLAVCVKPITGRMDVAKLVEWLEIQILAGVTNFIMYNSDLTGPGRFVLEHYAGRGLVTIVSFPYLSAVLRKVEPPAMTDHARYALYQELYLVAYHDCLYRFRGAYKYLAYIDLDEVILPSVDEPLPLTINRVMSQQPAAASLVFLTAWHFEDTKKTTKLGSMDIPDYLNMAQHPVANTPVDSKSKSVIVTDRALTVSFNEILETIGKDFVNQVVPWKEFAYLHHYRGQCKDVYQESRCQELLNDSRVDPVVTRYTERLRQRVYEVLDHLQLTRYSLE